MMSLQHGESAQLLAAIGAHQEVVALLRRAGCSCPVSDLLVLRSYFPTDGNGTAALNAALWLAVRRGSESAVSVLLAAGADANTRDEVGDGMMRKRCECGF